MGKEILTFGDTEIEKNKFYCNKTPIFIKNIFKFYLKHSPEKWQLSIGMICFDITE